jgi:hypothetical protein
MVEGGDGGGDRVQDAERGAGSHAFPDSQGGAHVAMVVIGGHSDVGEDAQALVELIAELHRASSDAAGQGLPMMARRLDECRLAFASELADDRSNEHELVERARCCLGMWRAMREW